MKFSSFVAALCLSIAPQVAHAQDAPSPPPLRDEPEATERTGFFHEPGIIGRAITYGNRLASSGDGGERKNGFYPEFGNMITGSGWISGGPGYRQWLFTDRVFVDASAAVSWRMYKTAQARIELPALARSRITAGAQVRWQDLTQVSYFGNGPDSLTTGRSEYRMRNANLIGYAIGKPRPWLSVRGTLGWITRPSIQGPGGTFESGDPDTRTLFPDDPVYQLVEQPNYMHGGVSLVADTRDHRGYASSGGTYQVSWSRYGDHGMNRFGFDRYEAEGAQFVPLASDRIVLVGHAWFAGTRADEGQVVPFYLQPSLGGSNSLRAYPSFRFHDRNLLMVNAEARLRLFTHLDWAVFVDAGNVAPTPGELNLDRRAYGMGVRLHTDTATFARLDVARGDDGWRVLFRANDPFRFSRLNRSTAVLPFVP